jgi:hypothetical protein
MHTEKCKRAVPLRWGGALLHPNRVIRPEGASMHNRAESANNRDTSAGLKDKVGDVAEQAKDKAAGAASEVRHTGEDLLEEGKDKAREMSHKAGEKARSRVDEEKDRVSGGMRTVADALRRSSQDLPADRDQYAPLLNKVADRMESASGYLDSRDVDTLTHDARRFAREHTPLFLGGAFALGLLGARFLKSSSDSVRDDRPRGYGGHDDYAASVGGDMSDRHDRALPISGSTINRQAPGYSSGGAARTGMTDTSTAGPRSMAASPATDPMARPSEGRPSTERGAQRDDRGSNE